jgi:hypothetical protein
MLRAGLEPATCRLGVDNRNRSGPQQSVTSRSWRCGRDAESNRSGTKGARSHQITEPLRPATIVHSRPARIRTRTGEVGARRAAGYTTGL